MAKELKDEIIKLHNDGMSQADITSKLGCDVDYVIKITNKFGKKPIHVGNAQDEEGEDDRKGDDKPSKQYFDRILKKESTIMSFTQFVNESKDDEELDIDDCEFAINQVLEDDLDELEDDEKEELKKLLSKYGLRLGDNCESLENPDIIELYKKLEKKGYC